MLAKICFSLTHLRTLKSGLCNEKDLKFKVDLDLDFGTLVSV